MQYVCNISLPVLPNWLESVRLNIGFPVVRTDGRAVYGTLLPDFLGWVDLFSYGAPLARALCAWRSVNIEVLEFEKKLRHFS